MSTHASLTSWLSSLADFPTSRRAESGPSMQKGCYRQTVTAHQMQLCMAGDASFLSSANCLAVSVHACIVPFPWSYTSLSTLFPRDTLSYCSCNGSSAPPLQHADFTNDNGHHVVPGRSR